MQCQTSPEYTQGSPEWLKLRRSKVTASDACIIMGSPYKTKARLYEEKTLEIETFVSSRMQRGLDLEPIARDLFTLKTGIEMIPRVSVKDWAMASLDGISSRNEILEIKCPGEKDHSIALSGKIPEHYIAQLQHEMYVFDSEKVYYFSFDGFDGVVVEVNRDEDYIKKMLVEEWKFYECLMNRKPPQ